VVSKTIGWEFESLHPCKEKVNMKLQSYFKESYNELIHKVSWPTWAELQGSAIVVMVASLIIALVVFVMDISFEHLLKFVYKMFF
jgi:preprotein translocase subunit SecE